MNLQTVYDALKQLCIHQYRKNGKILGVSTIELSNYLNMQRSNVSRELSKLCSSGAIRKKSGKPVIYYIEIDKIDDNIFKRKETSVFDKIVGSTGSLKNQIALAKAAVVYPPMGLHTLIVGETGVGKSFFAKCMYKYAIEINKIKSNRFIVFNCADYANNSQLLISHLFGVKKGAYTGALEDKEGIIEKGRDGIVFLDEVHRLPAEGQEMLFTLIDEGKYTPLGSTKEVEISLMIICATTENIDSTLLKTFRRRIPVTISLPTLRDRGIDERLSIIKIFIEEESKRINRSINIDEEALIALINYNCPNNIGQLKSDIQIACAKTFLRFLSNDDKIQLVLNDFSVEVRSGMLKTKKVVPSDWRNQHNNFLNIDEDESIEDKYNISHNIYEFIERRSSELSQKGYSNEEIINRLIDELENFINVYINNIRIESDDNDIKRLVSSDLYEMLDNFMLLAEHKLKRTISRNIFLGLLIHLNIFLIRVKQNKEIVNPKIDEIRKKYPSEFRLAMMLADRLEQKYSINVPIGEMGFIAMFFAGDMVERKKRVSVIVAMHGNSTASSMVDVANQLLNTNHVKAYNMPLNVKPEMALDELIVMAKDYDEGMGVLLIVDMGSLNYFSEIIEQKTRIKVRSIDMASTPTVIEAARKALTYCSLDEIVQSINKDINYISKIFNNPVQEKKEIIITACLTGEGTALKIKEILKKKFGATNYEILNLSMEDRDNFKIVVDNLKKSNKIKCIVGAFDPQIKDIDFISLERLFEEYYGTDFAGFINNGNMIEKIKMVYKEYLNLTQYEYIADSFIETLIYIKDFCGIQVDGDKFNGVMMHYGSLIAKLINREDTPKCKKVEYIKMRYSNVYDILKDKFAVIEEKIEISFNDDDICNIIEILLEI